MAITLLTIRFAGTVAYVDGSSDAFVGVWNGVDQILQNNPAEVIAAKGMFRQTSFISQFETAMTGDGDPVNFQFFTPSLSDPKTIQDMVLSLSGMVSYDDGRIGAYEIVQRDLSEALPTTNQVLLDIIDDSDASTIMNSLLTATCGFNVALS